MNRFPKSVLRQMDAAGVSDVANLLQTLMLKKPTTLVEFQEIYDAHRYRALRNLPEPSATATRQATPQQK